MNKSESISRKVAKGLLEIGAVGFSPDKPITFKSGIVSPVYVDNRLVPSYPELWHTVIKGFIALIDEQKLEFDMVAGIETAGILHSAALSYALNKPSIFIRKEVKDHGKKKRVEGNVAEKKVLVIEDHITTAGSSLNGIVAARKEGATITDCLAITSYGFPEAAQAFEDEGIHLYTLTTFMVILEQAKTMKKISKDQKGIIETWLQDPWSWGK
ncbi:MAG: orotate phosphoribosyltransferase [Patescibacteria group bacterium]